MRRACRSKLTVLELVAGIVIVTAAQPEAATAYERYRDGCHHCHGSFFDGTSPQGTVFPLNSKHAMHANTMGTDCSLCHRDGDGWNPYIGWSNGTDHNPPVGCTGCHGRFYGDDAGHRGIGLLAHHAFAGIQVCTHCHLDDLVPLPESVAPAYYGTVDTDVDDPCNRAPEHLENWSVGDTQGLDNDGRYDGADDGCCPGDLDGDSDVDLSDLGQLLSNYGTTSGAQYSDGDLDDDGDVDLSDLAALLAVYGTTC
jgi:hypothetical protein